MLQVAGFVQEHFNMLMLLMYSVKGIRVQLIEHFALCTTFFGSYSSKLLAQFPAAQPQRYLQDTSGLSMLVACHFPYPARLSWRTNK